MKILDRKISRRGFWVLLVVLFGITALFYTIVWPQAPVIVDDSPSYQSVAADLQDGRLDNLHGRTPAYPVLLIMTGSVTGANRALFITQLLLYFFSITLLVWLLLKLSIPYPWILIFVILALLPYNIVHTAYVLTETLAQFLLVSGIVLLMVWLDTGKWFQLVLSSVVLSLCALTRPTYQFLSLLLAVVLFLIACAIPVIKKRLFGAAAALALGSVIILGSMITYNATKFHLTSLTPDLGFFLSTKTARVLERLPETYAPVREILIRHRDQLLLSRDSYHTGYMYIWSAIPDLQQQTNLSYRDLAQYMLKLNLGLIVRAPLIYLQEVTYSFSNFWLPATTDLSDFSLRWVQFLWTALHYITALAFLGVCVFLGGMGLLFLALPVGKKSQFLNRLQGEKRLKFFFVILSFIAIFYTIFVTILTDMGVARHRIPVDLFIFTGVLLGIDYWFIFRKKLSSGAENILLTLNED